MLRLLYAYKDYYPVQGGVEVTARQLAAGFAARPGYKVQVLVTNPHLRNRRELIEGVEVFRAGRLVKVASTPLSPAYPFWMAHLSAQADITHLHFPFPPAEAAYLAAGRSKHLVLHYHSDIIRQRRLLMVYRPLLERILARAGRIIATSPRYIESSPFLQRYAEKCVAVPLAVDATRFAPENQPVEDVAALRNRLMPEGGYLLHSHGLARYYKGLEYLIQALPAVLQAFPRTRLVLTGSGHAEMLGPLVNELGLSSRVIFTGPVSDEELSLYYAASDLFVLPSSHRSEGFGIVLLEAMASERPVISTELGTGTSWVNRDGETGLVVPPREPEALAHAINLLLGDADLRHRFGVNGRRRVENEFTVPLMLDRVEAVYADVMGTLVSGG